MKSQRHSSGRARAQSGAASVEFALIALFAFLPLLLAVVELGRLFYVATTVQEVTRRAARQQVVSWISQSSSVQRTALFHSGGGSGAVSLPGGPEVTNGDIQLHFYGSYADAVSDSNRITGGTSVANTENCLRSVSPCIRFVRVSVQTANGGVVRYSPTVGRFGSVFNVPLPGATLIMPAEALGLL